MAFSKSLLVLVVVALAVVADADRSLLKKKVKPPPKSKGVATASPSGSMYVCVDSASHGAQTCDAATITALKNFAASTFNVDTKSAVCALLGTATCLQADFLTQSLGLSQISKLTATTSAAWMKANNIGGPYVALKVFGYKTSNNVKANPDAVAIFSCEKSVGTPLPLTVCK